VKDNKYEENMTDEQARERGWKNAEEARRWKRETAGFIKSLIRHLHDTKLGFIEDLYSTGIGYEELNEIAKEWDKILSEAAGSEGLPPSDKKEVKSGERKPPWEPSWREKIAAKKRGLERYREEIEEKLRNLTEREIINEPRKKKYLERELEDVEKKLCEIAEKLGKEYESQIEVDSIEIDES